MRTPWSPRRPYHQPQRGLVAGLDHRRVRRRVATAPRTTAAGRLARLEAVFWLSNHPLPLRKLARSAGLSGSAEARRLLADLRSRLASRLSALDVVEVAGGWRLVTRPAFEPWLAKADAPEPRGSGVEGSSDPPRLTRPAAETLAVVAWRQPVLRAEIEAIRGVGCGEVLRQLLAADLLRIVGRSEGLGRPLLYGTTDRFLEYYGLRSLADLPGGAGGVADAGPTTENALFAPPAESGNAAA